MEVFMGCYTIKYYLIRKGTAIKFVIYNKATRRKYVGIDDKTPRYFDDIGIEVSPYIEVLLEDGKYSLSDSKSCITISFAYSLLITFSVSCDLQKKHACCGW